MLCYGILQAYSEVVSILNFKSSKAVWLAVACAVLLTMHVPEVLSVMGEYM